VHTWPSIFRFESLSYTVYLCCTAGELGVQDFIKSIKGVEAHADKVAQSIIGVPTLLQTRSSRLKKLGIPCKQVRIIFMLVFR